MKMYKKGDEYVVRFPSYSERLKRHREKIESFRREHYFKRTFFDRIADEITEASGSFTFLVIHVVVFVTWIGLNINVFPGFVAFDPFPFGLLTMIVSLEAIFLSIFVLLSQNTQAKVADLREETNLQVNLIAEKEITKLIQMQAITMKRLGIRIEGDDELEQMMQSIDTTHIKRELEKDDQKKPPPIITDTTQKAISGVMRRITNFFEML